MLLRRRAFLLAVLGSLLPLTASASSVSCVGSCGGISSSQACWCDPACTYYGDCCPDAYQVCGPALSTQSPGALSTEGGPVTLTVAGGIDSLGSQTTASAVSIGGVACDITQWTGSSVTCTAPAGVGTPTLSVSYSDPKGATETVTGTFSYEAPVIQSLTPSSDVPVIGGTPITIAGTGFGPPSASATVYVNGTSCTPTAHGQTQLVFNAPAGSAFESVWAVVGNQTSNKVTLVYGAPHISSIGGAGTTAGGNTLTLTGTNFTSTSTVTVGGSPCPITEETSSSLSCTVPAGAGGMVDVVVSDGIQTSNAVSYTYAPPTIASISPSHGATAGGTSITVNGTSFGLYPVVTVDGLTCAVQKSTHTSITCTTPAGMGLGQPVQVMVADQVSNLGTFNYDPPAISTLSPSVGSTAGGSPLTITGTNFGAAGATVTVGGAPCPLTQQSQTSITCTLPAGSAGASAPVMVVVDGQSATAPFSYAGEELVSLFPATGPTAGGTLITINGTNFGAAGASVTIGGSTCPLVSQAGTQVVCRLPAGSGTGLEVVVTINGLPSNALTFSYDPPVISSVTPNTAASAGGVLLTVTGTNFGPGNATVTVGTAPCPVMSASQTQVVCMLPAGSGSGLPVTVLTNGQSSPPASFSYDAPAIGSVSPLSAPPLGGTALTLTGQDFGPSPTVLVGRVNCPITSSSETQVICTIPAGTGSGLSITLAQGNQLATATSTFSYVPALTAISPSTGPTTGGTTLLLTGSSFSPTGTTVSVGSYPCTNVQTTETSLTCTTSPGIGSNLSVEVSVNGLTATGALTFSYAPPVITGITPADGSSQGGTAITLTGSGFGPTAPAVTIGGRNCPVTQSSDTSVTCTLPAGTGTNLDVVVTAGGQAATDGGAFSYDPVIKSVSPIDGPAAGGVLLTIKGVDFGTSGGSVSIGGNACPVTSQSETSITCTLPPGVGANQPLLVTFGTLTASGPSFSYDPPGILNVSPATGPTAGGIPLTLTGVNFGTAGATVTIGGASCPVTAQSDGTIVCTLPPGTGLNEPVVVTVGSQSSPAAGFSYQVQAPLATAGSTRLAENSTATVTLTATDPQGLPLTYEIVAQPPVGQGTVTLSGAQATYTPPTGYFGTTGFSFRASNGQLDSNTAQVTLTVTQLDSPPRATAIQVTTQENVPLVLVLQGTSTLGSPLTYAVSQPPDPSTGQVVLSGAQATFTPAPNYIGDASFSFTVSDGQSISAPATVQISIVANNSPPIAQDIAVTTPEDTAVGVTLSGSDETGAPLTFTVQQPAMAQGSVTLTGSVATFTPAPGFSGTATFTYVASDGTSMSAPATVTITVTRVNKPPVADGQVLQTPAGQPLTITLTGTDPQDSPLTFAIVTPPPASAGAVALSGATATFTPASDFTGTTSFVFSASDGTLSANATITITVAPASPLTFVAPTPAATITVKAGQQATFQVAAQGSGSITYSMAGLPSAATFDGTSGKFSWQTRSSDAGRYGLVVEASDGVQTATRTLTLVVTGSSAAGCGTTGTSRVLLLAVLGAVELLRRRRRSIGGASQAPSTWPPG